VNSRSLNVEWQEDKQLHKLFWPQASTWQPVMETLYQIARDFDREIVELEICGDLVDPRWYFARGILSDEVLSRCAHHIHSAIRRVHYASHVRDFRQKDLPSFGATQTRVIIYSWCQTKDGPRQQLSSLKEAAQSGSYYKFEKKWCALTPETLQIFQDASSGTPINCDPNMCDPVFPILVNAPIPPRAYVLNYISSAIQLAKNRRWRVQRLAKDRALAVVRQVFLDISDHNTDAMICGGVNEPTGAGAKFVHQIEVIFDLKLLADASVDAVKRARKINVQHLGYSLTPQQH